MRANTHSKSVSNLRESGDQRVQARELVENRGAQIDRTACERQRRVQLAKLDGDRLRDGNAGREQLARFVELVRDDADQIVHRVADALLQLR